MLRATLQLFNAFHFSLTSTVQHQILHYCSTYLNTMPLTLLPVPIVSNPKKKQYNNNILNENQIENRLQQRELQMWDLTRWQRRCQTKNTCSHHAPLSIFLFVEHVFVSKYNFNDNFEEKSFIWYNTKKWFIIQHFFYCQATIFLIFFLFFSLFTCCREELYRYVSIIIAFLDHFSWNHISFLCVCLCVHSI